jgi:molybdopterin-guanine dinucleotide biosynthesis protein A
LGGAPKGLLSVGGQRIIDRIAAALRPVTSAVVVVSNSTDAESWLPGARVVRDTRTERGSLVGIHAALGHATDGAIVVAWDMPFVTSALLFVIRDRLEMSAYAAVPAGPYGVEGLCAGYRTACRPTIDAALDAGDLRVSAMLARLPARDVIRVSEVEAIGDPARLFFNVNTPQDLELAERMAAL